MKSAEDNNMTEQLIVDLSIREIERYAECMVDLIEPLSKEQLWARQRGIPNSIGTIALHLTGNLNHYFGTGILQNGYARDRDREFNTSGVPSAEIISELQEAVKVAKEAAGGIDVEKLTLPYTIPYGEEHESLAYLIVRLATHFVYHYGQAQYAAKYFG
jgi:hypothetical protein